MSHKALGPNPSFPTDQELSQQIESLVSSLPAQLPELTPAPDISPSVLPSLIDHTLLAPTATEEDVRSLCAEADRLGTRTVCVNSGMIPTASKALQGSKTVPISVVGFPFGAACTHAKVEEARWAVREGAKEIDMVIHQGPLLSQAPGVLLSTLQDIHAVVQASSPAPVKVIIESAVLPRDVLIAATHLSCLAGAAFVKTSTGYALPPPGGWSAEKPAGARKEDVRLMYEIARPWGVEIKASGGIRSLETVMSMVRNGATRVGASGSKKILEEAASGDANDGGGASADTY